MSLINLGSAYNTEEPSKKKLTSGNKYQPIPRKYNTNTNTNANNNNINNNNTTSNKPLPILAYSENSQQNNDDSESMVTFSADPVILPNTQNANNVFSQHNQQNQQNNKQIQQTQPILQSKPEQNNREYFESIDTSKHSLLSSNSYSNYQTSYSNEMPIKNMASNTSQPTLNDTNMNNNKQINNVALLEKLNHIINLLEKQQVEPTQHSGEEFISYMFLGVFIIYIVDSFTRVGKYVR